MSEYRIDKNVPPPSRLKYPLEKLDVGDSFFVPEKTGQSMRTTVSHYQRTRGGKFITREVTEAGVSGTRVWRVA